MSSNLNKRRRIHSGSTKHNKKQRHTAPKEPDTEFEIAPSPCAVRCVSPSGELCNTHIMSVEEIKTCHDIALQFDKFANADIGDTVCYPHLKYSCVSVDYVWNQLLEERYLRTKRLVEQKAGFEEVLCFHGTRTVDKQSSIFHNGLDPLQCRSDPGSKIVWLSTHPRLSLCFNGGDAAVKGRNTLVGAKLLHAPDHRISRAKLSSNTHPLIRNRYKQFGCNIRDPRGYMCKNRLTRRQLSNPHVFIAYHTSNVLPCFRIHYECQFIKNVEK